jgi:hypothetical protein
MTESALGLPPGISGEAMCDKCAELDDKIAHYMRMSTYITDQLTLDGIKKLIERASAEKAALHRSKG